jgi:hypothetical protein
MTLMAKGCYTVIMGFNRPAFAVPQLVRMSRDYGFVFNFAMLAGALADNL